MSVSYINYCNFFADDNKSVIFPIKKIPKMKTMPRNVLSSGGIAQPTAMKVNEFTFLRDGQKLGYPFVESIRSVLPIVDEFVVALGPCEDETERMLREIGDPKIRILPTQWNERIKNDYSIKGFVYGQQKSIAFFNCTGDWAFYLEDDEVIHESELAKIRAAMEQHLDDPRIEALAFDYLHFYGNANTIAWSPRWYRSEVRILRNTIPAWAPEGLFFIVMDVHRHGRYPRAAHTGATVSREKRCFGHADNI